MLLTEMLQVNGRGVVCKNIKHNNGYQLRYSRSQTQCAFLREFLRKIPEQLHFPIHLPNKKAHALKFLEEGAF